MSRLPDADVTLRRAQERANVLGIVVIKELANNALANVEAKLEA